MLRLLTIGIGSIVLFVPAYMVLHPLLGEGQAAWIAMGLMYLGFPVLLLKLWKTYPPMTAVPIEPDDPILAECTKRAMAEFERFKKGLAEGRKNAFVKYAIAMKSGGKEHVWGVAHAIQGDHV